MLSKPLKTPIQALEENSKADLLLIHENMNGLIERAELISIQLDDSESYKDATNLKKVIKSTHVAIEKKRKELKTPIIEAGKKLDAFAKHLYVPLKEAEALLKEKMLPYEKVIEEEKLKEQEKKEEELKSQEDLQEKLNELNKTLFKINTCKSKNEINQIETDLSEINLNDFGDRSSEAGFIVSNLKMTCSMVKKSLPDDDDLKSCSSDEIKPLVVEEISRISPLKPQIELSQENMGLDNVQYDETPKVHKREVDATLFQSESDKIMKRNVITSFNFLEDELKDENEFNNLVESYSVSVSDVHEMIEKLEEVLRQKKNYQHKNK